MAGIIIVVLTLLGALAAEDYLTVMKSKSVDKGDYNILLERLARCDDYSYNRSIYFPTQTEHSYQCNTSVFNYTTSPNFASCYADGTEKLLFNHSFLTGNIPAQTIYWDEVNFEWTIIEEEVTDCEIPNIGRISISKDSVVKRQYTCDFSEWGNCGLDLPNKMIVCDSKYDGNSDGKCDPGESCINVSFDEVTLQEAKGAYTQLKDFNIKCARTT